MTTEPLDTWEARWSPYDETTYATVLAAVRPQDVVLDIGAGDLRLARRLTGVARHVIAWELQPDLLARAPRPLPDNLTPVVADARTEPVPVGVTVAVLLMRHCQHYALYVSKLRAAGCQRLLTNVRWHMGVEVVDLSPGVPFASVEIGWYACRRCGTVGFAGQDASQVNEATLNQVTDVEGCPSCC